uniref:Uncharacterized protein n=1 Tax=Anguilla anguilla TaxID=7936 RepID=A0A0E9VQM2_ANGAN
MEGGPTETLRSFFPDTIRRHNLKTQQINIVSYDRIIQEASRQHVHIMRA